MGAWGWFADRLNGRSATGKPTAAPQADSTATGERPSPRQWREVSPMPLAVPGAQLLGDSDRFESHLTTRRTPLFLQRLGHARDAAAPRGILSDVALPARLMPPEADERSQLPPRWARPLPTSDAADAQQSAQRSAALHQRISLGTSEALAPRLVPVVARLAANEGTEYARAPSDATQERTDFKSDALGLPGRLTSGGDAGSPKYEEVPTPQARLQPAAQRTTQSAEAPMLGSTPSATRGMEPVSQGLIPPTPTPTRPPFAQPRPAGIPLAEASITIEQAVTLLPQAIQRDRGRLGLGAPLRHDPRDVKLAPSSAAIPPPSTPAQRTPEHQQFDHQHPEIAPDQQVTPHQEQGFPPTDAPRQSPHEEPAEEPADEPVAAPELPTLGWPPSHLLELDRPSAQAELAPWRRIEPASVQRTLDAEPPSQPVLKATRSASTNGASPACAHLQHVLVGSPLGYANPSRPVAESATTHGWPPPDNGSAAAAAVQVLSELDAIAPAISSAHPAVSAGQVAVDRGLARWAPDGSAQFVMPQSAGGSNDSTQPSPHLPDQAGAPGTPGLVVAQRSWQSGSSEGSPPHFWPPAVAPTSEPQTPQLAGMPTAHAGDMLTAPAAGLPDPDRPEEVTNEQLDFLACRLYPRISRLLRLEVTRQRDRVGSLTDFRH